MAWCGAPLEVAEDGFAACDAQPHSVQILVQQSGQDGLHARLVRTMIEDGDWRPRLVGSGWMVVSDDTALLRDAQERINGRLLTDECDAATRYDLDVVGC